LVLLQLLNITNDKLVREMILTYSMEQSPSWEANGLSANQEITRILWNPQGSLPYSQVPATCPYPEPAWSSPYTHAPFPEDASNIILPSTPGSPEWSPSLRFPYQNPVYASTLSIRATCPARHIHLDLIVRTVLYRSLSSSLCSFLHSLVTSSLLGQNIVLNTLFSKILSLRSSFNVSDQVSHPY
jgi:hypothetical protein